MGLALDELKQDDDTLVESNGVKVIYSKDIEDYVTNLTLDFMDKWYNKGFRFVGNDAGSCR